MPPPSAWRGPNCSQYLTEDQCNTRKLVCVWGHKRKLLMPGLYGDEDKNTPIACQDKNPYGRSLDDRMSNEQPLNSLEVGVLRAATENKWD